MRGLNIRYFFILIATSFAFHIVWENFQAPLYAGFVSFSSHFSMCFWATIADVVISAGVLLFVILLKQASPMKFNKNDFIALAVVGFVIAVAIEQNALLAGNGAIRARCRLCLIFGLG